MGEQVLLDIHISFHDLYLEKILYLEKVRNLQ